MTLPDTERPDCEVTETVTAAAPEEAECLMPPIPTWLLRGHPDCVIGRPQPTASAQAGSTPTPQMNVTAPDAGASAGSTSGSAPSTTPAGIDEFSRFRVDPDEIESKIRHEADRRYRDWTPTKAQPKRPRKSVFERQVRKEFY